MEDGEGGKKERREEKERFTWRKSRRARLSGGERNLGSKQFRVECTVQYVLVN